MIGRGWLATKHLWERFWERFWANAPRRLRFTREGKVLVGIAFASGLAAINTGNNLLFLGWGMVLSAIVLSGVLSEATLRIVRMRTGAPEEARVGQVSTVPVALINLSRRTPAFAVEIDFELRDPDGEKTIRGPFQLRLAPATEIERVARFVPTRRGLHRLLRLRSRTSYPFGFFEKSRRFRPRIEVAFWVAPHVVDVAEISLNLLARLGEERAHRVGRGDDFFSLRPYRSGDDPRRIHWRRSAKSGRLVVAETEAQSARAVMLELCTGSRAVSEHGIAVFGSLAEALLVAGFRVGVLGPGTAVPPGDGGRQRWAILLALAKMDVTAPTLPVRHTAGAARVAVATPGAAVDPDAYDTVVAIPAEHSVTSSVA